MILIWSSSDPCAGKLADRPSCLLILTLIAGPRHLLWRFLALACDGFSFEGFLQALLFPLNMVWYTVSASTVAATLWRFYLK